MLIVIIIAVAISSVSTGIALYLWSKCIEKDEINEKLSRELKDLRTDRILYENVKHGNTARPLITHKQQVIRPRYVPPR